MLFRNAAALERLAEVDTLVVDKTGTLTEGRPVLAEVRSVPGNSDTEVLGLAASVEAGSEHPLAGAIVAGARARGLTPMPVSEFRADPGTGVSGRVGTQTVVVGRRSIRGSPAQASSSRSPSAGASAGAPWPSSSSTLAPPELGIEDPIGSRPAARWRTSRERIRVIIATETTRPRRSRSPGASASPRCTPVCFRKERLRSSPSSRRRAPWWRWPETG